MGQCCYGISFVTRFDPASQHYSLQIFQYCRVSNFVKLRSLKK